MGPTYGNKIKSVIKEWPAIQCDFPYIYTYTREGINRTGNIQGDLFAEAVRKLGFQLTHGARGQKWL